MRLNKQVFIFLLLLFGMFKFGYGQSPPVCPEISLTGPEGVVGPNEIAWYEVSVGGASLDGLDFDWTSDVGKIVQRQGKTRAGFMYGGELSGISVTVTVTAKGLPDGCPAVVAERFSFPIDFAPVWIDEFSISTKLISPKALASAAKRAGEFPNSQIYIIEYFPRNTSRTTVNRKLRNLRTHFSRRLKFDTRRVTIIVSAVDGKAPLTKFYIVPPGAENPLP